VARNFVRASNQALTSSSVPVTAVPLTIACWGAAANSVFQTGVDLWDGNAGSPDRFGLFFAGNASRVIRARSDQGGTEASANSATGYTAGVWCHAAAVFASSTSRTAYLNGAAGTTNTTSNTPSGVSRTDIGGSTGNSMSGQLAEIGVWSVALEASEIAALAAGACPLLVRPDSLVSYWPLMGRYSPEIDVVGGLDLTLNASPAYADHPRIFRSSKRVSISVPAAGGGGGGNRRRRVITGAL
jgi:hypothetical protein